MGPAEGAHRWVRRRGDFDTPGGGESSWLSFRVAWSGSTDKSFGLSPGRSIAAQRHPTSPIQFLPFWPSWPSPSSIRLPCFPFMARKGERKGEADWRRKRACELYCSQNVKRSLPITVKQSLSQKGHGKEGVIVGPHGAPPTGETFTNHPLSLRACSPTTTRV